MITEIAVHLYDIRGTAISVCFFIGFLFEIAANEAFYYTFIFNRMVDIALSVP